MTRDDARRLMSRYAMGTLSESERRLLFEAALEDQELFEELAREDELKAVLDEPGARDRLIAALGPRETGLRRPVWIWSAVSIAALALAVIGWTLTRTSKPVEVAQVAVQPSPPAATAPEESPAPVPEVAPAKPVIKKKAPAPVASGAEAKTAPSPAREEPKQQPSASRPPAPTAQETVQVQAQTGFLPAPAGAGGGGARAPAARPLAMAPAQRRSFGFDYTLEPETLTLKFAADGWLSLHFAPGDDTISLAHVTAGQIRREAIPNNATEAAIVFAVEAQTDPTLGVNLTRTDKSGTVEDPSGRRIEFLLKFY